MDARKTCSDCVYFDDIIEVVNDVYPPRKFVASKCRFNPPTCGYQQPRTNGSHIACHEFVENPNE